MSQSESESVGSGSGGDRSVKCAWIVSIQHKFNEQFLVLQANITGNKENVS